MPIKQLLSCSTTDKTKFIFIIRNPKDVVVSYYNHAIDFPIYFTGDFHQFFDLWITGEVPTGDYFSYVAEWLNYRNERNFLFVFYENLIRNPKQEFKQIAEFIGVKCDSDEKLIENVLNKCSLEYMRNVMKEYPFLVRKGQIGEWRGYLTKEQSDIIDRKIRDTFGDFDIWKNDISWINN
jgi:hypothetical protein